METKQKLPYEPPSITVIKLEMEEGIAAGPAVLEPSRPHDRWEVFDDPVDEI